MILLLTQSGPMLTEHTWDEYVINYSGGSLYLRNPGVWNRRLVDPVERPHPNFQENCCLAFRENNESRECLIDLDFVDFLVHDSYTIDKFPVEISKLKNWLRS